MIRLVRSDSDAANPSDLSRRATRALSGKGEEILCPETLPELVPSVLNEGSHTVKLAIGVLGAPGSGGG